ncbi:hypothetical protein FQR65_LT11026 [Abscondita terminalis]|nr:hypothetical protein FQR65_LT11026 [Abscondita terminalis]
MKYVTSIYEIIDLLYYPAKLFAIAPYIKTRNALGERVYVRNTRQFKYFANLTFVLIVVIASSLARTLLEIKLRRVTLFDCIRGFIYITSQMAAFVKILELVQKQTSFLTCLQLIDHSDKLLKDVGVIVNYRVIHALLLMMFIVFPIYLFGMVAPVWEFYDTVQSYGFTSREALIYIAQFINLAYLYGIRFPSVYLYSSFAFVATQRLHSLNEYIKSIEENGKHAYDIIDNGIICASEIHSTVTALVRKINKTFAWSMFTTISLSFTEIIASIVMRGELTQATLGLMFFVTTVFSTTALSILLIGERLRFESSRIGRLLCNLTAPYNLATLNKSRSTVLYQVLQEPPVLTAGGFYVLSAKTITSHIGLLSTVLMFFLKLRDIHNL